jgi:hypothetical protein
MALRFLSNFSLLSIAIYISITMVSCATPETKRLQSLHNAQMKYNAKLKLLPTLNEIQLAAALEKDSRDGREPWNSLAFDEATERIERDPHFAQLLAPLVNKSDRSALLGLLAIRRAAPSVYKSIGSSQSRTEVLVDALKNSKSFNLWGLPHLGLKDASQALIEENDAAAKALIPLLDDKSEAPAWGSYYSQETKRYQYAIRDYALAISQGIEAKREGVEYKRIILPQQPARRAIDIDLYKRNFDMHRVPREGTRPVEPAAQPDPLSPGAPGGLHVN